MPQRLIPAGAGQIRTLLTMTRRNGAHPRRCGADTCPNTHIECSFGSSPQVRGRLLRRVTTGHPARLIPAGAGQIP